MYEKIDEFPAALYKKIHLAIFRNNVDLSFLVELILDEKERKERIESEKIANKYNIDELNMLLYKYEIYGDIKSASIIKKAIEIKKG